MAKRGPKRRERLRGTSDDFVDTELLIEAEALASERERTAVPGQAAIRRAMRDIVESRRKAQARAEALTAGLDIDSDD